MSRNRIQADFVPLRAGPALVQRLLPQRPPFLMIDCIDAFAAGDRPAARASRFLSANEPFFQGHFPELPLMPGALLMEGAGQTASLVYTIHAILDAYEERGASFEQLVEDLANLDRGFSLKPGYRVANTPLVLQAFDEVRGLPVGVAGGVRLKFLRPVTPGCRLVYEAQLTHRLEEQLRFEVTASVEGEAVLEGSIAAAIVHGLPIPGRDG
ncbi:MAG: beta-hydroxyacyl-ACP dehydratase [Deltaproteobacteria bacterium]|nr:beta-hydroxyacyl-ACP dehydratase [Deltaproteobacteria bacterium]